MRECYVALHDFLLTVTAAHVFFKGFFPDPVVAALLLSALGCSYCSSPYSVCLAVDTYRASVFGLDETALFFFVTVVSDSEIDSRLRGVRARIFTALAGIFNATDIHGDRGCLNSITTRARSPWRHCRIDPASSRHPWRVEQRRVFSTSFCPYVPKKNGCEAVLRRGRFQARASVNDSSQLPVEVSVRLSQLFDHELQALRRYPLELGVPAHVV